MINFEIDLDNLTMYVDGVDIVCSSKEEIIDNIYDILCKGKLLEIEFEEVEPCSIEDLDFIYDHSTAEDY